MLCVLIFTRNVLGLLVFLSLGWLSRVIGNQYIYVNQSKTWEEAREYCRQKGFELSNFNGQGIEICKFTEATELWTNNFTYTTPYLALLGCYRHTDGMQFSSLQKASVVECQILCRDSKRFAIRDNSCTCIQTDSDQGALQNAEQCNYTCDGRSICGGDNAISIYEQVANISDLLSQQPLFPPNNSRCLVYQCVNGTVDYQEKDCVNQDYANDNYFSCSFEPDTDCFLWHAKDSDLKWSIQNHPPQNSPGLSYSASYYAYVRGSGASGQKAVLISRMKFKASDWCLRFRYFGNTSASMDIIIWDLVADKNHSLVKIRNSTNNLFTKTAWYLVERNINMTNDFKLVFKFETVNNVTDISIDDVTMIAAYCNKTVSTLLNKGRGIQCTFGGNFDVCFKQDESNDDTNWNLSHNLRWLSTRNPGEKAVLISKFELYDIKVNISMKFSGRNNLELYSIDKQGNRIYIIEMNDNNGGYGTISRTIYIDASSNLYICGTIKEQYQEIRINFIKINVISESNTHVERVKGSYQIPDPYAMTIAEVANLRCIDGGGLKMSNTIKLLGELLPKNGMPSAVQIYRINYSYWETFDFTSSRTFVCEQDSGSTNRCKISTDHELPSEGLQGTNVVGIGAVLAGLLLLITICIASIIVYKWKQHSKKKQNTRNPSMGGSNTIELTYEKVERTTNVEEEYDHLHQYQNIGLASS